MFGQFMAAAIGLTLLAALHIQVNAVPFGDVFGHLLAVHDLPAAWMMLVMLLAGAAFGLREGAGMSVERLASGIDRWRYPIAAGLWVVLCVGSIWIYRSHPLSMDEYAAVFQAKVFAAGAMHGQFPPDLLDHLIPHQFQNHFLMVNRASGAVVSAYWPGFSLLLAPFVWFGIPWACNPTLVAGSVLLIGRLARDLGNSSATAGWAMLFALSSPAFVANGISYYSMPAHLLLNLVYAWLLLAPSSARVVAAGLVGGLALALHNPFPHVVFAAPWVLWLATRRGNRLRNVCLLTAGYLPMFLTLIVGWSLWRGEVLQAAAMAVGAVGDSAAVAVPGLAERTWTLLRGFLRVLGWPHESVVYSRLGGLAKLWLWASPLLLLLAWWGGRQSKSSAIRLLGASALTTFFAYFLIRFSQGHGWGYRYFHPAWGALPVLAALGAAKLMSVPGGEIRWGRTLAALALASLVAANGLRFYQMGRFMSDHLAQSPPRASAGFELVMHNDRGYYGLDLIQNDPWLRGNSVVAHAGNEDEQSKLLSRFRHRFDAPPTPFANRFGITYADRPLAAGR
ncbi:MAG: hypothetical protein OEL20_08810 [Sulfuritalea sp.]|nr:hypothetical protein [Sulfuritalea sp.]